MNTQNGLLLWVLGGAGVLFIYAAYKNQNPQTILSNHLQGTAASKPIASKPGAGVEAQAKTPAPGGVSGGTFPGLYADRYGNPIGELPPAYRNNPALFIMTGAVDA